MTTNLPKTSDQSSVKSSGRFVPAIAGVSAIVTTLLAVWYLDRDTSLRYLNEVRSRTVRDLATVRGAGEIAINKRVHLTLGLKAYVSVNPTITEQDFADFAALMMSEVDGIRSVTLIKDNVINDVYPRAGNEGAIGLELLKHPDQRAAAEYAIQTGKPWLAGPIKLVQGGEAFVNRAPVYITESGETPSNGEYWGMVSILINRDTLVNEIMASVPKDLSVAVRNRNDRGEPGDIFLGDTTIDSQEPIVSTISLPTGSWQLYGVPRSGWPKSSPYSTSLRLIGGLLALVSGAFAFSWAHVSAERNRSQRRIQRVFDAAPTPMLMADQNGRIMLVNTTLEAKFGFRPGELFGESIDKLIPATTNIVKHEAKGSVINELRAALNESSQDLTAIRKDGSDFHVAVGVSPAEMPEGQCILASIIDMTERKEHEDELQRYADELARSNRELDDFANVASHDLKAPMRGIAHLAQWIAEDCAEILPQNSLNDLKLLQSRVYRLLNLLDDMLKYARAGRITGHAAEVDSFALVKDIAELLAPPVGIIIEASEDLPTITTYKAPFQQVLHNLISNAIKHHDREAGCITVTATPKNELVEFQIADDGPGIPSEYHKRVFGMFQKLKSPDEVEGSGIGLAVVKRVIESQGGEISVESEGRGTTFRFTWPDLAKIH